MAFRQRGFRQRVFSFKNDCNETLYGGRHLLSGRSGNTICMENKYHKILRNWINGPDGETNYSLDNIMDRCSWMHFVSRYGVVISIRLHIAMKLIGQSAEVFSIDHNGTISRRGASFLRDKTFCFSSVEIYLSVP